MTEYHFARVLETFAEKRSFAELERVIRTANGIPDDETAPIDRRKLKKLVERDPDVVMTPREFEALDRWLEPQGHGLAFNPLFRRLNLLQAVADASQKVTFLPGSKPDGDARVNLDHWDVRALAKVQRGVNRFGPHVVFDIRDVFLHEDLDEARRSVAAGSWTELLADNGPSIVVPGSGRATHACELILANMFGAHAMTDDQDKSRLPFHFVWPEGIDHVFPSGFRYTIDELAEVSPQAADTVRDHGAAALEIDGRVYLDTIRNSARRETYGVAVAQRRPGGQIWLVLAGITGPATLAAARLVDGLPLDLLAGENQSSPVYWTAVRAKVKQDRSRKARMALMLSSFETISPPQPWPKKE